jgi:hypothetical protein
MAYNTEYVEARQTLELSVRTASEFVRQLGALAPILIAPFPAATLGQTLGRRPGFQATVLDHRYWFAKLYELVTYQELNYSVRTRDPGFSLHFIKIFYGMYYDALKGKRVSEFWNKHFQGPPAKDGRPVEPDSMEAVEYSVLTGAIAHIQGDMPIGLVTAYNTWNANPKPAFQDLSQEFIDKSQDAFKQAQARFYIEVNDKTFSPLRPEVGQFAAATYQKVFNIRPDLSEMFEWRRIAWHKAACSLDHH